MSESDPQHPAQTLEQIAAATRYPIDAFHFVRRALDHAVHSVHEDPGQLEEAERHVSGRQLCEGLRDLALKQYGMLARPILRRWRINRTEDIGRIVFAMVNGGLMQKTSEDTLHDFDEVFDFDQAFHCDIPVNEVPLEDAYTDSIAHG